jgi:hypothetical protein
VKISVCRRNSRKSSASLRQAWIATDSLKNSFVAKKTPLALQGAFFVNGYEKVKK